MAFTRRTIDASFEKRFLIGLIVSDRYCRESRAMYNVDLINSEPVKTIAKWCYNYFDSYEDAPQRQIKELFEAEETKLDETLINFIETLLERLSEEFERSDKQNIDYLLDETEKHFKDKSLLALSARIRENVNAGNTLEAEKLQVEFTVIKRQRSLGVNPFTDFELIERSLSEVEAEPLFKLPGKLGEVMNPQFYRSSLIALQGPEKRGKTFWMDELCIKAFRSRCNVALFDAGDMTYEQKTARIMSHITGRPLRKYVKLGEPIAVPVIDCLMNQNNSCLKKERICRVGALIDETQYITSVEAEKIGYKACNACESARNVVWREMRSIPSLTVEDAKKEGALFFSRARGKRFKLSCHENSSLNFKQINSILEIWKIQEEFIPDVIGIDYPAIMAPEDHRKEHRNQVNDTWKAARALSQKWKCCVLLVDQTDADSYEKENIRLKNFTEDKRKYGHVTAIYSLNQTDEERFRGIMRIGELLIREGESNSRRQVTVLECRKIGRINLGSYYA